MSQPLGPLSSVDVDPSINALRRRIGEVERANRALERELVQRRLAEELARSQTRMLTRSLGLLAAGSNLDRFLGHVLKTTVQHLHCVGGTLWFPDPLSGCTLLHLEYLEGRVLAAHESKHPAASRPPPVGGHGISTFPTDGPETYLLSSTVAGMPEENRAYIQSLGVRALLTVPMTLGRETVGWICLRSRREDATDLDGKVHLAVALANQATLAVQMARLGEQARVAALFAERNRIARDIHDTLAQGFTGILVALQAAERSLDRGGVDRAREQMAHASALARTCLDEARISVRSLRPAAGGLSDLGEDVRRQLLRLDGSGVAHGFAVRGTAFAPPPEIAAELLRVVQESLTNVLRHAQASRVDVEIDFTADRLRLAVVDDGVGFDPAAAHDGFGLQGMRERCERVGGWLEIDAAPGRGVRLEALVPTRDPE